MNRKEKSYVWPLTLHVQERPPKVVYLDLNHWITLAKVVSGSRDGQENKELLEFCLAAVEDKSAVFPISLSIYTEIYKIKDQRRRRNLRRVIEELSQYMVVTNRAVVAIHEIEALLDREVCPNPEPINTMDYLDWGILRAMGVAGDIRVRSENGDDIKAGFRQSFVGGALAFDKILSEAIWELNRKILDGPSQAEEFEFRQQGYNPEAILKDYENEAANETEWARLLDDEPKWRRGRLRDLVSAREIINQINSILKWGCDARGVDCLKEVFPTVNDSRRAFDSMPSFDASVTLKTSIHRNGNHRWTNNDVHDIHALALTLPYCDIVVTDRAMMSHAVQSKLGSRLNTIVLSDLSNLSQYL